MRRVLAVLLLLAAGAANDEQKGKFQATWPLPDDETYAKQYAALGTRHGFKIPENYPQEIRAKNQTQRDPTYELYVPPAYRSGKPFGLIVWINAGEKGNVPRPAWTRVLDKHGLIWVGPNDVGNNRDTLWRTYMAIEAVRSAKLHYTIDDARVYVAGLSGGGRIASHAALVGADTFTGGFYIVGCDFWRDVPVTPGDKHGKYYQGFWRKPDGNLLRKSRQNRYVLLTGTNDFNLGNTRAVFDGYKKDEYANATFLEVPGMGHTVPDGEWFEKGIALLDAREPAPRPAPASRPTTRPKPTGKIIVGPR